MASGIGDGGDLRGPWPGRGTRAPIRYRIRASRTAARSRDPGQVPFADRVGQDLGGVQAGQFGAAQGAPQPPGLVAGPAVVFGGQGGGKQVSVALLAGGVVSAV